MRILVTNDDGIDSEGLHVLARSLTDLGDVVVVAPDKEYSGASAALGALHMIQPEVHHASIEGVTEAWAVSGPPALCVMFSAVGAFGQTFDLVVAGINPGANVGRSVYHSGTVGAALTARTGGLSGVAVSQAVKGMGVEGQGWDEMLVGQKWETAASVAKPVVAAMIERMPEHPVVVNLNVPNLILADIKGWKATTLSRLSSRSMSEAVLDPKAGHPGSYRVRMEWGDARSLPADTDAGAVERDFVSLTFLGPLAEETPVSASVVTGALDQLLVS